MSNTNNENDHKTTTKSSLSTESFDDKSSNVNISNGEKVADEVVKHILNNVIQRKDLYVEGSNLQNTIKKIDNIKSKCKGDTNTPTLSINSMESDEHRIINQQIDNLVTTIREINVEMEHIENTGISKFIDKQKAITKDILDTYITSTTIHKLASIGHTQASTDVTKSPRKSQTIIDEQDTLKYYPDEQVLRVQSLEVLGKTPEAIPLPYESDEDLKESPKLEIVVEGQYSDLVVKPENDSKPVEDNPEKKKKKKSLKRRLWNFFTKNTSDTSKTTRLQQIN